LERLHKILFELSSVERINIMIELQRNELKLSQISRKLEITVTETFRHLQRLEEAMLIQKDTNGRYKLTRFGSLTLFLLEDLGFVSKHRDFFMEYDISAVPHELIGRIGEIAEGDYSGEALKNLEEGEKMIREAQEFVWIVSDQVLTSTIQPLTEKMKNSFDLRIILPEGKFPPENKSSLPSDIAGIQKRVINKVDVLVVLTEKYAIFCLPNKTGRIDYTGFTGKSPRFRAWCKDLFIYYWNTATPVVHTQDNKSKNQGKASFV
jgi:predicted transcriptional regulator